jgi:hypothetical protein
MTAAQITSLLELAANVTLTAIPATTAFVPLITGLEAGINPLLTSLTTGSSTTTDVLAGYGALIAVITTLKATTGIDPTVLAKLDEYLTAAQNGTAAALAVATAGYNAAQLAPVTPIA